MEPSNGRDLGPRLSGLPPSSLLLRVLPYLVLLAQVLVFYRHVLFHEGFVIPWDMRYDHFPIASFIAESLKRGELPLWDPYTYCGRPLFANIQAQLFYPPTFVAILASNLTAAHDLLYALEWQLVLHVFLGGAFTYALLRRLGLSRPSALIGGTIYQLGGYFASQAQHLVGVNVAAWMPLTWLCVLALRDRFRARWAAALAFSLAMSVLAGLPAQMAITFSACLLLATLLIVFRLASWKLLGVVAACSAFALLLAGIQFFPTTQLTFLSVAQYRTDWLGSGGGLRLESLVSLVWPSYYGIFDLATFQGPGDLTFLYVYCSLVGLLLALAAILRPKTRLAAMFAILTVLSVFWMLGDSTVVGRMVFRLLPQQIQIGLHPEFALAVFVLSMAVMAAFGAEQFLRRPPLRYAALAVIFVDLTLVGSGRPMNAFPTANEPGVTRAHFDGFPEILEGLRALVNRAMPPLRIDTAGDSLNWAMCAPLTEVPSANGNDPFALARLIQVRLAFCDGERWGRWYEVSSLDSPVLDLMNVGYVLSREPLDEERLRQANFRHAAELPGRQVYENTEVLPRFFLVSRVRRAATMEEAARILHAADFQPRLEAVVESDAESAERLALQNLASEIPASKNPALEETGQGMPAGDPENVPDTAGNESPGEVSVVEYSARKVVLETDWPAAAFLATSESNYPGWRASIDGQEQPLYYTNVAFRGLPVPPGRHTIEMRFDPPILQYSAVVSGLAWLLLAGFCWRRGRRTA
jgi:Bacterial membrane protein YfhO